MSRFAWSISPSPLWGQGFGLFVVSPLMPALGNSSAIWYAGFSKIDVRTDRRQTTPLPRLVPSPRPFGEKARVRGKALKATQESKE